MNFTEHDEVIFGRAPLVNVISQIKFEPVFSLVSEVGIAGFQEGLRLTYPQLSSSQASQLLIGGPTSKVSQIGYQQSAPIWQMRDIAGGWIISLSTNFVAFEARKYSHFNEFLDRLMFILDVLDRTVNVSESIQIGLRKVNHIVQPADSAFGDWKSVIRPELLGAAGIKFNCEMVHSISELMLKEDSNNFRVVHGLIDRQSADQLVDQSNGVEHESNGNENNPGEGAAKVFLLDLDCFTMDRYPVRKEDNLELLLNKFSDQITSFFHSSITRDYYEWLEPRPKG
ncbi:MAG: TIGR04255 family protein [Acidimicrobiales bacterium]|nr:TIGR04255 family protein [Acidimicrobiales bacterium]